MFARRAIRGVAAQIVSEMGGGSSLVRQIGSYTLPSLLGGFSPQIIDIDWF